jgi:hypothetical protein
LGIRLVEFQGDVANEKENILGTLLHVGMASTVIEDKTLHERSVGGSLVAHGHNLDHVQVDGATGTADGEHSIHAHVGHLAEIGLIANSQSLMGAGNYLIGDGALQLGAEGSTGNTAEELGIKHVLLHLERFKSAKSLLLCQIKALRHYAWVKAIGEEARSLLKKLADEKDVGGRSITGDVILGSCRAGNEGCRGMLDLLQRNDGEL